MTEPVVEPSLGRRYERKAKIALWPFVIGAVLVAGVGAMLLTSQAYRPPYLETTTVQALSASALNMGLRVVPLAIAVFLALFFGIVRKAAPHQAPLHAAAIAGASLIGAAVVVVQAGMEKAAYERDGREQMQTLLQRTSDRYENEVLMSHRALNNRLATVTGPGYFLWAAYRPEAEPDYDRLRDLLDEARGAVARHHAHIARQQAEAMDRIAVSRISRFGKAEAQHALETRFTETDDLRDRHFELANQILDELDGEVDILERADGAWRANFYEGVAFGDEANRLAFQAHQERLAQLGLEVNEVTAGLVAEGQRVRADAYDRALAERQAEMDAESATTR